MEKLLVLCDAVVEWFFKINAWKRYGIISVCSFVFFLLGHCVVAPFIDIKHIRLLIELINSDQAYANFKSLFSLSDYLIDNLTKYSSPLFLTLGISSIIVHYLRKYYPVIVDDVVENLFSSRKEAKTKQNENNILKEQDVRQADPVSEGLYKVVEIVVKIAGIGVYPVSFFIVAVGSVGFGTALKLKKLQYEFLVNSLESSKVIDKPVNLEVAREAAGSDSFLIAMVACFLLVALGVVALKFISFKANKATIVAGVCSLIIFFCMKGYQGWKVYDDAKIHYEILNDFKRQVDMNKAKN
jgi:hypothetical protein